MKKAVLYYRTSNKAGRGANKGLGYETQKQQCRQWCKDNGVEITGEYFDDNISGDDDALEKSAALIDMLANMNGQELVVSLNSSRILGRGSYRQAYITRELRKMGKQLILVDNPTFDIHTNDPTQIMLNSIIEAVDVFQKMEIAMKLHRARKLKVSKQNTKAGARAPLGFKWVNNRIEVDKATRPIVEEIFRLSVAGYSGAKIATLIEGEFHYKITARRVINVLNNRAYLGEITYGDTKSVNSEYQLISNVQFGKAQASLARRAYRKGK
jgi:site-specific DNA recombinase